MTMQRNPNACHRDILVELAHEAMIDRGLAPDFDPSVKQQLETLNAPAEDSDPSISPLRAGCARCNRKARFACGLSDGGPQGTLTECE